MSVTTVDGNVCRSVQTCFLGIHFYLLTLLYKLLYNSYMEQDKYQVLRIWKTTHSLLRRISAWTDESLVETLDRLAKQEWQRIQRQEQGDTHNASVQEN